MVIIKIEASELRELTSAFAEIKGETLDKLIEGIINKYFPCAHTIDKEEMAKGYKEMGDINLDIANGVNSQKR